MITDLLQILLDGLLDGAAYALVGLGLSLTFGSLRRLNLAYGATAMLAAYVGAWMHVNLQAPAWLVAVVVIGTAIGVGAYVEQLCFAASGGQGMSQGSGPGATPAALAPGADGREVVALASSFAVWMQLEQLAVNLLPRHLNAFPSLAAEQYASWGGVVLRLDRMLLGLLGVALVLLASVWVERTRSGLAWRAVSGQRIAAQLVGMPPKRLQAAAFAVASALSGLAAFAVLALNAQVTPMFGMWMLMKGLAAALLGGLGSLRGVLWGGIALGLLEAVAQALLGAQGREFASYAVLFAVLAAPGLRSRADLSFDGGRA